jgi:hypothetical protein
MKLALTSEKIIPGVTVQKAKDVRLLNQGKEVKELVELAHYEKKDYWPPSLLKELVIEKFFKLG